MGQQNTRQPILRGAKITTLLLSILFVSALISSIYSRPTSAESFLHKSTCGIVGLLGIQCKTAPASADAPSSSGSGTGHSQSAMPPSNDATTPSQPAPSSFTPVDLPDQQLPTITPVNNRESSETVAPHDFVGYSLPTFRGADENGGSAVLGATDQAPLQSSSEGWKMFGIAWYWWVIAIAAIVMLGRLVTKRFRARRHASHLTQHS